MVRTLCGLLDELRPRADGQPYAQHDRLRARTARATTAATPSTRASIERELGWRPAETFETGIRKTVQWYLDNAAWTQNAASGAYRNWVAQHYGT